MRTANALRHIEHIASLALAPHIAIPEMLRALHGVVPGARTGFFWVGATGEVLDAYAPLSAPDAVRRCGTALATGSALLRCDPDGGFQLTVSVRGQRRAILTLQRATRSTPFTERERRMLVALAPCFGRALDSLPRARGELDDVADRVGVIVAGANGRLLSADAQARQLLIEMLDQPLTPAAWAGIEQDRLPPFLGDFLRAQSGATGPVPAALERTSRWGVYRARAFAQLPSGSAPAGPPTHAVILSRHLPRTVRMMRAVERFDLSPRERQAAFQLGIGSDAAGAAAALGVSIATWRSYVKRVYQRLGVNDRVGLIHRLHEASLG